MMNQLLIIAILILGDLSVACAGDKDTAYIEKRLRQTVAKQPGNFLVARIFHNAVTSLRRLLMSMQSIADSVTFDANGPVSLARVKDMIDNSRDLKYKFDATVGEFLGGMMAVDEGIITLTWSAKVKSSDSARELLSLDRSINKLQILKGMLDKEVRSTCDEYSDVLRDWSGVEVFSWMNATVTKLDSDIKDTERNLETLAQNVIRAELAEAASAAKAAESSAMLRWINKQDDMARDEREWNKITQLTNLAMDAASSASGLGVGPISLMIFGSKKKLAPLPDRPAADVLSAAERAAQIRRATQDLQEAKVNQSTLAKQVKDANMKARSADAKLRMLERERAEVQRQLEKRIKERGAISVDHAKTIFDSVSSFFNQKKNLIALTATISSFDVFIKAWHDIWQAYDSMTQTQKSIYMETLGDTPMGWGMVAPEIWTTVQLFPDLLEESSSEKVPTYRESVAALWDARDNLIARRAKTDL